MIRILLAEDDHDMRRFLAKALQNAGYDVVAFDNGLSAYERIREEPFSLLLTDIVMPKTRGGRAEPEHRLRQGKNAATLYDSRVTP
jgi:two-component system cell cycle response regulator CpdR